MDPDEKDRLDRLIHAARNAHALLGVLEGENDSNLITIRMARAQLGRALDRFLTDTQPV